MYRYTYNRGDAGGSCKKYGMKKNMYIFQTRKLPTQLVHVSATEDIIAFNAIAVVSIVLPHWQLAATLAICSD